jgi:hypothetical protein
MCVEVRNLMLFHFCRIMLLLHLAVSVVIAYRLDNGNLISGRGIWIFYQCLMLWLKIYGTIQLLIGTALTFTNMIYSATRILKN